MTEEELKDIRFMYNTTGCSFVNGHPHESVGDLIFKVPILLDEIERLKEEIRVYRKVIQGEGSLKAYFDVPTLYGTQINASEPNIILNWPPTNKNE